MKPHRPSGGGDRQWADGRPLPKMENRLPVGAGSRGGAYSADVPAYYRRWRKNNVAYREREAKRAKDRRSRLAEIRAQIEPRFTEAAISVVAAEVRRSSLRAVSRHLGLDHSNVFRWLNGKTVPSGEGVDAIITTYGLDRVIFAYYRLVRERARAGVPGFRSATRLTSAVTRSGTPGAPSPARSEETA